MSWLGGSRPSEAYRYVRDLHEYPTRARSPSPPPDGMTNPLSFGSAAPVAMPPDNGAPIDDLFDGVLDYTAARIEADSDDSDNDVLTDGDLAGQPSTGARPISEMFAQLAIDPGRNSSFGVPVDEFEDEFEDESDDEDEMPSRASGSRPAVRPVQPAPFIPAIPGEAWVRPRDPRAPFGNAPLTIYLPDNCARLALFYRGKTVGGVDNSLEMLARAPVTALLQMLGFRTTRSLIGFAPFKSNRVAAGATIQLAMSLKAFTSVPEDIVGQTVAQVAPGYALDSVVWLIANTIDRAVRHALLLGHYRPGGVDEAAIGRVSEVQKMVGAPLSIRTQRLNNVREFTPLRMGPVRAMNLITEHAPGQTIPADFYFSESQRNLEDPLARAISALLRYAQTPRPTKPELHPVFVGSNAAGIRLARNMFNPAEPPTPETRMYNTVLRFGELAAGNPSPTKSVGRGTATEPFAIRTSMAALRIEQTDDGQLAIVNGMASQITLFWLPIWAICDAFADVLETRPPGKWQSDVLTDPFHVVHARAVQWHAVSDSVQRPISYMYALPAALVRVLLHGGYGPVRTYAADCLLGYAVGEFFVRPSVAAAEMILEILDVLMEIPYEEYRLTFYLPPHLAQPTLNTLRFVEQIRQREEGLTPLDTLAELAEYIEPQRNRSRPDAENLKADILLAATVAFARGRLSAAWLEVLFQLTGTNLPRYYLAQDIFNLITGRTQTDDELGPFAVAAGLAQLGDDIPDKRREQIEAITEVRASFLTEAFQFRDNNLFLRAQTFSEVITATNEMQAVVRQMNEQLNKVVVNSPYFTRPLRGRFLGEASASQ